MHVYMFAVCVHAHVFICMHVFAYMHTCVCVQTHICVCVYSYTAVAQNSTNQYFTASEIVERYRNRNRPLEFATVAPRKIALGQISLLFL